MNLRRLFQTPPPDVAVEIDHGRVGWAHLASCTREGWGAEVVRAALPEMLDRSVGMVIRAGDRSTQADDERLQAHGWLSPKAGAAIYRRALHEVIFPGLEAVAVDTTAARAHTRRSLIYVRHLRICGL